MTSGEKQCITCLADKPLAEFGRNSAKPDGLQSKCRACVAKYQR